MTREQMRQWMEQHPLRPLHVDCVTAVMLKILDGKCKMSADEQRAMRLLYDEIKQRPGRILGADVREIIAQAHASQGDAMAEAVHQQRLRAEALIAKPQMKAFKTLIRESGVLANGAGETRT